VIYFTLIIQCEYIYIYFFIIIYGIQYVTAWLNMRHCGKPLTSFVIYVCALFGGGVIHSSESPSETLQSLPVSVAATMNFAQLQTKAANDCQ